MEKAQLKTEVGKKFQELQKTLSIVMVNASHIESDGFAAPFSNRDVAHSSSASLMSSSSLTPAVIVTNSVNTSHIESATPSNNRDVPHSSSASLMPSSSLTPPNPCINDSESSFNSEVNPPDVFTLN